MNPPINPLHRADRGLQAERTALSWNRTGLAVMANALLVLRAGWESGSALITVPAMVLVVAATGTLIYARYRRHQLISGAQPSAPPNICMAATAAITCLSCAIGVISILIQR